MPWSGVTPAEDHALEESTADWDAAEAASRWAEAIAEPAGSVPLSVGSGQLWVQPGTFDPLFESSPEMDAALVDDFDWSRTGVIIVQLAQRDGEHMASLAASVGATVLDGLPEDAWVLRLPTGDANHGLAIVEQLAADDQVRWIGAQQPGWRLAADLHPLVDTTGLALDLDLTPAGDLSELALLELEIHLTATGAEAVRCDAWLCQVRGIDSAWLGPLALDGRLLFTDAHFDISLLNDYARSISRIDAMTVAMPGLNGSGEVAALSDSGLDSDHGDFDNRVRQIYHNFGPDNSASDMNSGHGTHVSASMLGDGSGAGSTRGVAPGATFHFYQLEHDASGNLARWGSLYDMFRHSWQANARVQSNSWGAQLAGGDYTSDSRSADAFAHDYEDFLILFAAGNEGSQGSGSVAPPSTGKNVLTVGASTTGRPGTPSSGQIASFSSIGPTDDGRIKPDIVAPGVSICSARAWEASAPGPSCSSARHSDGTTPLYMSADGTSSSTPIVGGAALLARQFLREQLGINQPHAALVKALLINRASDLGTSDIPNADEGWGQLDLEQSLDPTSGLISLNTFQDTTQSLTPGYAYVYTYDLDVSYGLDVTLTWMDAEGSASAAQSAPRLMNDLDLVVIAPDGTEYKGNDFANGLSTTGGTKDALNNVERVRLDSGAAGNWSIRVEHAGGASQSYAIVIQAVGNENPMADLSVIDGSIWVKSGGVNPTSTIQALALYIANAMKQRLINLFD